MEVLIAGDPALEATMDMVCLLLNRFLSNKVLLLRPEGDEGRRLSKISPFVKELTPTNGSPRFLNVNSIRARHR